MTFDEWNLVVMAASYAFGMVLTAFWMYDNLRVKDPVTGTYGLDRRMLRREWYVAAPVLLLILLLWFIPMSYMMGRDIRKYLRHRASQK